MQVLWRKHKGAQAPLNSSTTNMQQMQLVKKAPRFLTPVSLTSSSGMMEDASKCLCVPEGAAGLGTTACFRTDRDKMRRSLQGLTIEEALPKGTGEPNGAELAQMVV